MDLMQEKSGAGDLVIYGPRGFMYLKPVGRQSPDGL